MLVTLPDKSEVTAKGDNGKGYFMMLAKGTADFIAEAGEIVAWLVAAVRCSPDEGTMAYCTPRVGVLGRYSMPTWYHCEIEIDICTGDETKDVTGRCWHGMFRNPVVAGVFLIPRRPRANTGLEVPLHMAAHLMEAESHISMPITAATPNPSLRTYLGHLGTPLGGALG